MITALFDACAAMYSGNSAAKFAVISGLTGFAAAIGLLTSNTNQPAAFQYSKNNETFGFCGIDGKLENSL